MCGELTIGLLSDIHSDYNRLIAVYDAMINQGASVILNAGDNVGYGKDPEKCINFLMNHSDIYNVRGNYDKNVAKFPEGKKEFYKKWGKLRPGKYKAIERDSDNISERSREWLLNLPKELIIPICDYKIFLTHYAPYVKEGLGPWTTDHRLEELSKTANTDIVATGHTHYHYIRTINDVLFLNPGAVGRSIRASYIIVNIINSGINAEIKHL